MPRPVTPETCLAAQHPVLAKQWVRAIDSDKGPHDVRPHSKLRVLWQCPEDERHQWEGSVTSRAPKKPGGPISSCPYCSGHRVLPENSIKALHPALAQEYAEDLNGGRPPTEVGPGSGKAWWRCTEGHTWQKAVQQRVKYPTSGCPICASIFCTHPHLLEEWDYEANDALGLDPKKLTPGSGKKPHWICKTCGYRWRASVNKRANRGTGCPACAGQVVTDKNCLATVNPTLADEWHPTKNGDTTPRDVAATKTKAWWICRQGHPDYPARISNRHYGGTGCPVCGKEKKGGRPISTTLAEACSSDDMASVLAAGWRDRDNSARGLAANRVGFQSHALAMWDCPQCSEPFERSVANWFTRQPALCEGCSRGNAAEARRLDSIAALAEIDKAEKNDRAVKIMLAQWDVEENAKKGLSVETTSASHPRRVAWRCGACGYQWKGSARHRRASIRQKLEGIKQGSYVDEPDNEFACPRCCVAPGASITEIALGLELKRFFPSLEIGFLKGLYVAFPKGRGFKPDLAISEHHLFIEYDGCYYHKDKAARDERIAKLVQEHRLGRMLRLRERSGKARRLPALDGVWTLEVAARTSIVELTAQVLEELAAEGIQPTNASAPALELYRADNEWLTEREAIDQRRLLGARRRAKLGEASQMPRGMVPSTVNRAVLFLTDHIVEIGAESLMELYDKHECRWNEVSKELGFQTPSGLTGAIRAIFHCTPTQLAEKHGRPVIQPSRTHRVLAGGEFDHLLGKLPDSEIAKMAGCRKQSVEWRRKNRGIDRAPPKPHPVSPFVELLGKVPDSVIAEKAGCSRSTVGNYRRRLGIPAPLRKPKGS